MRRLCLPSLCVFVAASVSAADLSTLKGTKVSGEWLRADNKVVVLKTPGGEVATASAEILKLELTAASEVKFPEIYVDIELIDGSLFHCKSFKIVKKNLEMTVLPGRVVSVPIQSVSYILNNAQDEKVRRDWDAILSDRGRRDRFFLVKDGRLDGLEGTFGESTDGRSIPFELASSGQSRPLPIDRLAALLFNNRLEGNIPQTLCRVIDSYGSTLVARSIQYSAKGLRVDTVSGVSFEFTDLKPIVALDYSKDKILYVSDMKLREDNPYGDPQFRVSRDVNLESRGISIEGVAYSKGLVIHAGLTVTVELGGDYKEFRAVVGFDDSVSDPFGSDVRITFEGDGRKIYELIASRAKPKPEPVSLDVKKVRNLKITVASVEGLPTGRQIALGDAKVSK